MRIPRRSPAVAAGLVMLSGAVGTSQADPPGAAASAPVADQGQIAEIKGGFMSAFSQGFKEDFDREVVRGHFDVRSSSNTLRYYCLFDPKKARNTPNAVSGDLVTRRDGMTGIKGAAVTPLSCADAEQKGFLITAAYVVKGAPATAAAPAPPAPPAAAPAAAAATVAAAAPAPAAGAPPPAMPPLTAPPAVAPAAAAPAEESVRNEVMAVFERFIAAQNAHDRSGVAATLLESKDFVWAQYAGNSVWGYTQALDAFEHDWKGIWRLDPQLSEARVTNPAPDAAMLITPLLFTEAAPGATPSMVPIRWGGVFVRTRSGWRIASILITPFKEWRAPRG